MSKNTLTVASVLALLFVFTLSFIAYFKSPLQAPPAKGWQTYTNQKFLFSFKYPSSIRLENKVQNPAGSLHLYFYDLNQSEVARLHIYPGPQNLSQEFLSSHKLINNINWNVLLYPSGLNAGDVKLTAPILYYETYNNGISYSFQFDGVDKISDAQTNILSTFKFINLSEAQSELKTYKNKLYEFKYPTELSLSETNQIPTLTHSISYKNYGGCDMSGLGKPLDNLVDFNVTFELQPGNYYPYDFNESQVTYGGLTGRLYTNGVEGCGEKEYYFPINGQTLVVKKTLIQPTELSSMSEEILKTPGVISPDKSEIIFTEIMSSFKIY